MQLSLDKLISSFGGTWEDKSGKATQFASQDSNYRLYQPDTKPASNSGLLVYVKIDHIRGSEKDDHAQITLGFDKTGALISSEPQIQLAQADDIPATVLKLTSVTAAGALGPAAAAVVQIVGQTYNALAERMAVITDDGGRLNFPAVIAHTINKVACAIEL
ncbi:MAG TPA: hypothetical protein VJ464_21885 [Blastocatellia bacterium]|nr:hypothetical protein [Blastocatellia bacterium]